MENLENLYFIVFVVKCFLIISITINNRRNPNLLFLLNLIECQNHKKKFPKKKRNFFDIKIPNECPGGSRLREVKNGFKKNKY